LAEDNGGEGIFQTGLKIGKFDPVVCGFVPEREGFGWKPLLDNFFEAWGKYHIAFEVVEPVIH
jgi:hypothetical protein